MVISVTEDSLLFLTLSLFLAKNINFCNTLLT